VVLCKENCVAEKTYQTGRNGCGVLVLPLLGDAWLWYREHEIAEAKTRAPEGDAP